MHHLHAILEVARQTLRLLLQDRLSWLGALLQLAVALLALLLGFRAPAWMTGQHLYAVVCWWLSANVLMPWTTMYFAVRAVHGDIEDRTLQYVLVRPVARTAVLLGKCIAVVAYSATVHVTGAVLLFAAVRAHGDLWSTGDGCGPLLVFAAALGLLAVAYTLVGAMFSALFRHPLVWSAAFIVGVQMLLANLPARASIRHLTIADPVRRFVLEGLDPDRRLARALWPSERDWDEQLTGTPLLDLLQVATVALAIAIVAYTRSEYDSRPRE